MPNTAGVKLYTYLPACKVMNCNISNIWYRCTARLSMDQFSGFSVIKQIKSAYSGPYDLRPPPFTKALQFKTARQ